MDLRELWRAYQACRKGKRKARDTQAYESRLLDRLVQSRDAIASKRWRPSRTTVFVVSHPKLREIHAAPFADRVVHHALVQRLTPLYERVFIHDSHANCVGHGTHLAVDRLQAFMRSVSQGGQQPAYALQLDIANFFNSIHRPTLWRLMQHRLRRRAHQKRFAPRDAAVLQSLCRALLTADASAQARPCGNLRLLQQVPAHKRLGGVGPHCGLPIGNLTSQFFANVYLNELDQFIKHTLRCKHYVRYVDDFVLLHPCPLQLRDWRERIEAFLAEKLSLRLKCLAEPHTLQQGTDFLGYVVRPFYRLARRRVVRRMAAHLQAFAREHLRPHDARLAPAACALLRARLASYLAYLSHANSHRLWQRVLARFPWLERLFKAPTQRPAAPASAAPKGGSLPVYGTPLPLGRPQWEPQSVSGLASQWRWLQRSCPGHWVLIQVGRFWLLPTSGNAQRQPAIAVGMVGKPRDVMQPGLGPCLAWPLHALDKLRTALRAHGLPHAVMAQTGHFKTGFKRRALVVCWSGRATNFSWRG